MTVVECRTLLQGLVDTVKLPFPPQTSHKSAAVVGLVLVALLLVRVPGAAEIVVAVLKCPAPAAMSQCLCGAGKVLDCWQVGCAELIFLNCFPHQEEV